MQKSSVHSIAYITVFILIISVIIYLNLVFQENLKKDIIHQFNRQQVLLAKGAALNIEKKVDRYVKQIVSISKLSFVQSMGKSFSQEQMATALMDDLPRNGSGIINFQLVDRKGTVRLDRYSPEATGVDISGREYFRRTSQLLDGEVYISEMTRLDELNPSKRYIVIATPIYSIHAGGGEGFNGIALFAISVEDIVGDYVYQIRMGERGYAWIIDSRGTLVYHPGRPEMIGRNLFKADKSCFECHKSFTAEKAILQGGVTEYGIYTAPMGQDKLISYWKARVGPESWLICVTTPYSEVTGLIAKSMKLYSWLISIIFLTVIGTSVYFIVLIKRTTAADERAKYASELEDRIKERTAELSHEKEKLNAILSGFGAGVSLIDRDYNVEWANEVITQNVSSPVGKRCYAAYRGFIMPCNGCPLPAAIESGNVEQGEMVCRRVAQGNGGVKSESIDLLDRLTNESAGYFQIVIAPIKDKDGTVTHVVELIRDITGVRKLEQQMLHSEKLSALGRMTAGIAHEIGNPLTAIYSYIQILQGNKYDEFTNSTLDIISFHITRIREILQQMSGFSRNYQIENGPVDVNEAVKASLDLLDYDKAAKGCVLTGDYYPGKLMVVADEKWLVSVFVNLLLNSLDAMPDGGRLAVRTLKEGRAKSPGIAVVEIADNGVGIPPENLGKIFDPFFTTKQTGKGTGLGLAVSYNIIKDLKGDISVSSSPGEGTTFTIRLPLEDSIA
jgi:signal transduction histidine kinase